MNYFNLLVFPTTLSCDYSLSQLPFSGLGDVKFLASVSINVLLVVVGLMSWKKYPVLSFAIAFFFITMSLYTNIVITIGSHFGDRFLFLPSLGYCLLFAWLILKFLDKGEFLLKSNFDGFNGMKMGPMILLVVLTLFSFKTISRNADWESNYTLYSADVESSPGSARTHYYYALELVQEKAKNAVGKDDKEVFLDQAIVEYKKAIEIYPDYPEAYDQMGLAYFRKGDLENAAINYEMAIKTNPGKATAYSNLGGVYFNTQRYQKAMEVYEKAVQLDPRYADAWQNLGSTYASLQMFDKAIFAFNECLKYAPNNAMVYYFLGLTYQNIGKPLEGEPYLQKAYSLNPKLKK